MLVEGVDFSLQVRLVAHHLVRVLLEAVDLEGDGLLVLLELAEGDLKLLASKTAVLANDVFVLVGLEQLPLSGLVLLVQIFKVAQLSI